MIATVRIANLPWHERVRSLLDTERLGGIDARDPPHTHILSILSEQQRAELEDYGTAPGLTGCNKPAVAQYFIGGPAPRLSDVNRRHAWLFGCRCAMPDIRQKMMHDTPISPLCDRFARC